MRQNDAERLMAQYGEERERSRYAQASERHRLSSTKPGRHLLRESVQSLSTRVEKWADHAARTPGVRHAALDYVQLFKADVLALITCVTIIDRLSASASSYTSLISAIARALEDEHRFESFSNTDRGLWELTRRENAYSGLPHLRRHARMQMAKNSIGFKVWPKRARIQVGGLCLDLFEEATGLIGTHTVVAGYRHKHPVTKKMVHPEPATVEWLKEAAERYATMFPLWMPCRIPPMPWKDVHRGGYHTDYLVRYPLIRTREFYGNYPLDEVDEESIKTTLAAVNAVQATPWELNRGVYDVMSHFLSHDMALAGLPPQSDEPIPDPPEDPAQDPDSFIHSKVFRDWVKRRHAIKDQNIVNRTKRLEVARMTFIARRHVDGRFWFPHHCDFRGRIYPTCSGLQPQGCDMERGLLQFAVGKAERWQAHRWFKIHGANTWGEDKCGFGARIVWVDDNREAILEVARDPVANLWWTEADKPWQFLAWCLEFGEWVRSPETFISHLPISVDGSNNGLQIFSLLLRDTGGAAATNVLPLAPGRGSQTAPPKDIYADVAEETVRIMKNGPWPDLPDGCEGREEEMAVSWLTFLDGDVPRAMTKRIVMTTPYGVTAYSALHYIADWYREECAGRGVTPFAGEGYKALLWLTAVVSQALDSIIGSAKECMGWLRDVADVCSEHSVTMRWTSPSGFLVVQGYENKARGRVKTYSGVQVRFRYLDGELSARRQRNGISPNFVHSLDAAALAKSVVSAHEAGMRDFMVVHDSFGCHAADVDDLLAHILGVYHDIFKNDCLQEFREQIELQLPIGVKLPDPPALGNLDVRLLLDSQYFFS